MWGGIEKVELGEIIEIGDVKSIKEENQDIEVRWQAPRKGEACVV